MTRFLKSAIILAFLLPASFFAKASGSLFVYFDAACMDRLEYANPLDPTGAKYIVFQVNTSSSDKMLLTVGNENPNPVASMPAQILHCGNTIFDQSLVRGINQQQAEVYMVRPSGDGRFFISKVSYASSYSNNAGALMYQTPRYQFAFQTGTGIIGENLSIDKSASVVQFEGRIENGCSGEYIFSMSGIGGAGPFAGVVIAPEMGVIEERSGATREDALRNVLRLERVNGRPAAEYLRIICRGERPVPVSSSAISVVEMTSRGVETPAPSGIPVAAEIQVLGANVPGAQAADPCGESSGGGYHIVRRGENLYRISLAYKVSVSQLREWNNLDQNNNIHPCQKLRVAATAPAATATVLPSYSAEQMTARGVADAPVWKTYTGTHIVQPGETIASIAMKYGYTEYRFRHMNNLGSNDVAKVGQSLRTSDCDAPQVPARATAAPLTSYETLAPRSPMLLGEQAGTGGRLRPVTASTTTGLPSETELTSNAWRAEVSSYTTTPTPQSYDSGRTGQVSSNLASRMAQTPIYDSVVPQAYETGSVRRTIYTVANDETLPDIARRFNTTTENLRRLNNLNPGETVIPGQRLFIN